METKWNCSMHEVMMSCFAAFKASRSRLTSVELRFKGQRLLLVVLAAVSLAACKAPSQPHPEGGGAVSAGPWSLSYADGVNISRDGRLVLGDVVAEYRLGDRLVRSTDYAKAYPQPLPKGGEPVWTVTFEDDELPRLVQRFRLSDGFLLADVTVEGTDSLRLNYVAPVVAGRVPLVVDADLKSASSESGISNPLQRQWRQLFVPFDNDAWIRYRTAVGGEPMRSYEVTALYDAESREGLVVGAVSHDVWKNAIDLNGEGFALRAASGVADSLTRDRHEHGFVSGREVRSATMFIGLFSDWREGLEAFADANAAVAPPRAWEGAMPVGWNSWGALAFRVNHDNATEVVRFVADSLQSHSFKNEDGLVFTGLDSGWNNFTEAELKDFADECRRHHQVPCIYWTPFTDWGKNPQRPTPIPSPREGGLDSSAASSSNGNGNQTPLPWGGAGGRLLYKDLYLYADGKPQELDGAYALDPTHPAVEAMMRETHDLFRRCGYEYVKMDFMTHGRMEADSWYRKDITTGTQAYNYGMHLLDSIFSDMYLNLSISPIFPAQYAQSRRIACDAWNKMKDTEYTMNALTWGWWIDRIYRYNDADHVVLRDATEGENRARITSSVITGLYIAGDDFSRDGDPTAKARACQLLTNPEINRLATGRSFRPLTGDSDRSEHCFLRQEANGDYVLAVFNYGDEPLSMAQPLAQMGIDGGRSYTVSELWTGQTVAATESLQVPPKDARVYRFHRKLKEVIGS